MPTGAGQIDESTVWYLCSSVEHMLQGLSNFPSIVDKS